MTMASDRPAVLRIDFVRVGSVAAILLVAMLALIFAGSGALSEANPRTNTAAFLQDVAGQQTLLVVQVWAAAVFSFLIAPFFAGLFYGLRRWSDDFMRVALFAGVGATVFGAMSVALQAAGAGHIVPAWIAATDEATRAGLLSDLQVITWMLEVVFRMFDLSVAVATLAASFVMLRMDSRLWGVVGWVGVVSGLIHIPSVFVLFFIEAFEPVHLVADVTFLLWVVGAGIGLWRLRSVTA